MNMIPIIIGLAAVVTLGSARVYQSNTLPSTRRSVGLRGSRLTGDWNNEHINSGLNDGHLSGRWNDGHLTGRWNDGQLTGRLNDGHLSGRLNDGHLTGSLNDGHLTGILNDGRLTGRWNDGQLTGRLNRAQQSGGLNSGKRQYRSRRSAVHRPRVSYRGNRGSTRNHFESGRFNRLSGNSGWRSNSGYNSRW
ncbi:Hypothetical predicted protein [Mytilus galloprovincialis]|nr:Hypothetical predicted protein [Mytilus galloprovincialis]